MSILAINEKNGRSQQRNKFNKRSKRQCGTVIRVDRHIDQWNRTENLEISPHIYGPLTFDEGPTTIPGEGKESFQPKTLK